VKHRDAHCVVDRFFLERPTMQTVFGWNRFEKVLDVNVDPWDVRVKVDSNTDTREYLRVTVVPRFANRILRDHFVSAKRVIITAGTEEEAEQLRKEVLACGEQRMIDILY